MSLFHGAMGFFRNPVGHRRVDYDDSLEAVAVILFADLPAPVAGANQAVPSPTVELLRLATEFGPHVRMLWPTLVAKFVARSRAARGFALDRGDAGRRPSEQ